MSSKEDLKSWHEDKTVQDNVVESWLCVDCGTNTAPGSPNGPEIRIAFARGEGVDLRFGRDTEIYDVKKSIWRQAGMRAWSGCLCVGCLEKRIGRRPAEAKGLFLARQEDVGRRTLHRTAAEPARLRDRHRADQRRTA